jgi:hypothetical protein
MTTKEFKGLLDKEDIETKDDSCYFAFAMDNLSVSVSFAGKSNDLKAALVSLMEKYKDVAEVVCDAAFYFNEKEEIE